SFNDAGHVFCVSHDRHRLDLVGPFSHRRTATQVAGSMAVQPNPPPGSAEHQQREYKTERPWAEAEQRCSLFGAGDPQREIRRAYGGGSEWEDSRLAAGHRWLRPTLLRAGMEIAATTRIVLERRGAGVASPYCPASQASVQIEVDDKLIHGGWVVGQPCTEFL